MTRTNTPDVVLEDGGRRLTVKRCCSNCGRELGDVTREELDAAMAGQRLPNTSAEHGCSVSPDCRDRNHQKCYGSAWNAAEDRPVECRCVCHLEGDQA